MTAEEFAVAANVSRETLAACKAYAALLEKWSKAINLVAKSTLPDLWQRHFLDSAQLVPHVSPGARSWIDLGSGAGFPGLVAAIVSREAMPNLRVTLIESDRRKAAFLREAIRVTGAPADVLTCRVEEAHFCGDVISARAFAPLERLLEVSTHLLAPEGIYLLLKGESVADELTAAARGWHIEAETIASAADPEGVILRIESVTKRGST